MPTNDDGGVAIRVMDFHTKYKERPTYDPETRAVIGSETVAVDFVTWHPIGGAQYTNVVEPVQTLNPEELIRKMKQHGRYDDDDERMGLKIAAMRAKWEIIGPAYEAWKAGKELPETGTPLAAWAGVTKEQIKVLHLAGVRSIEDLAHASDSIVERIRLPDKRALQRAAQTFLATKDQAAASAALTEAQATIESMQAEMAEMRQAFADMQKPRRGKRKADDEAEPETAEAETEAA